MTIYFDMDGTIANLYAVEGWLDRLRAEDASPYMRAEPMVDMQELSAILNSLQAMGYKIGVITWLSKCGTKQYNRAVRIEKQNWLSAHLPLVKWDEIHIVKYGTPKHFCCQDNSGILFDDNEDVRRLWDKRGTSFSERDIIEVLSRLL